jgi:O-antigen ligase
MSSRNPKAASNRADPSRYQSVFGVFFGALLGLSMLKFGNPAIMEKWVSVPSDVYEFILLCPWPMSWGYLLLGMIVLASIPLWRWEIPVRQRWLILLPLVWCGWQLVASVGTRDAYLTGYTVKHFIATVSCFYLGFFCLRGVRHMGGFWLALILCFLLVLAVGWSQHFGGLDQTRRYFFLYIYPQMTEVPPEYLKKMSSNRIFGTLFYPNTLAGVIILLLPPTVVVFWNMRRWMTGPARGFLAGCAGIAAVSCLYWSGSKGGWLLMLFLSLLGLLRLPFSRKLKTVAVAVVLLTGIAGFTVKYRAFFEKGATSVVARFDYWRAALVISRSHPWVGTGPGTFGAAYQDVRDPRSEPARLAHNDYLQQLSDSGIIGCLSYTGFVVAALVCSFPRNSSRGPETAGQKDVVEMDTGAGPAAGRYRFGLWLALFGWFAQGMFEFSLYVPGSAWVAFALLGHLLVGACEDPKVMDKVSSPC